MSEYSNDYKAKIIENILITYAIFVSRNCCCIEEHDHDLTKNPWEIEIKFEDGSPKRMKIHIEIEDENGD